MEIKNANANPDPANQDLGRVIALTISDGREAIRLIRRNAIEDRVDPKRAGIMGFSAGGASTVSAGSAPVTKSAGGPG